MHLAMTGLFRARWSNHIHDEWITSVLKDRADLTLTQLTRTRQLMDANVLDGLVIGYEHRINNLTLPDPDDRHVLAAAIETKANLIVTWNIKDFPEDNLKPHGIVAVTPDDFILDQIELDHRLVIQAVMNQKELLKNPAYTLSEFFLNLTNQGLNKTVNELLLLIPEPLESD
jgi:predicted nucleic acid-binding protein